MGVRRMKNLRNESGRTLTELLAVIVISSIIIIMVTSIILMINKQHDHHSNEIKDLTNVSTVAQAITKDIRSADHVEVPDENEIKIINGDHEIIYKYTN